MKTALVITGLILYVSSVCVFSAIMLGIGAALDKTLLLVAFNVAGSALLWKNL